MSNTTTADSLPAVKNRYHRRENRLRRPSGTAGTAFHRFLKPWVPAGGKCDCSTNNVSKYLSLLKAQIKLQIMKIISYGFIGACLLWIAGCNTGNKNTIENWHGGLIRTPGTYVSQDQQYSIHVDVDSDKILHYSVQDISGNEIIKSVERPSAFQKWCLFWDKNENLWVHSSDIGDFAWEKEPDGIYHQYPLFDDVNLQRQMPQEIFDCLPDSIRQLWGAERNK